MSEQIVTPGQGSDPVVQPPVVAAGADERQAIQEKYEKQYGAPAPEAQPVAEPVVTSTAAAPATPDYSALIAGLQAELAAMKAERAAAVPAPVKPAEVSEADWLALLAAGDKAGGEKALFEKFKKENGDAFQQRAVSAALEQFKAEQAISGYITEVRTKNPDLMSAERYITIGAQQRIQVAIDAGRVKSPSDYVTVYREAVDAELTEARNILLSSRGQGKEEGRVRTQEVLASVSLQPQAVNQTREAAKPAPEQMESGSDYVANRNAQMARMRGMA